MSTIVNNIYQISIATGNTRCVPGIVKVIKGAPYIISNSEQILPNDIILARNMKYIFEYVPEGYYRKTSHSSLKRLSNGDKKVLVESNHLSTNQLYMFLSGHIYENQELMVSIETKYLNVNCPKCNNLFEIYNSSTGICKNCNGLKAYTTDYNIMNQVLHTVKLDPNVTLYLRKHKENEEMSKKECAHAAFCEALGIYYQLIPKNIYLPGFEEFYNNYTNNKKENVCISFYLNFL